MSAPPRAYIATLLFCGTGPFQVGYQNAVYNQPEKVLNDFIKSSFELQFGYSPSTWLLSLLYAGTISVFALGLILGHLNFQKLADRRGRKHSLTVGGCIQILGNGLQSAAYPLKNFECLMVGRFVSGIGAALALDGSLIMTSELAPYKLRGTLGTLNYFGMAAGCLLANGLGSVEVFGNDQLWFLLPLAPLLLVFIYIVTCSYFPESPKFLAIHLEQEDAAFDALRFYNRDRSPGVAVVGTSSRTAATHMSGLRDMLDAIREETSDQIGAGAFLKLLCSRRAYKRSAVIAVCCGAIFPASGIYLMYSYLTSVVVSTGLGREWARWLSLAYPSLDILATCAGMRFIECCGRRPLVVLGSWMMVVLLLMISVCQILIDYEVLSTVGAHTAAYCIVAAIVLHCTTKGALLCPFISVLPYELFPTPLRACIAPYLVLVWDNLGQLVGSFAYPALKLEIGGWALVVLYLVPTFILACLLCRLAPESKGYHVHELMRALHNNEFNMYDADSATSLPQPDASEVRLYGALTR